MHAFDKPTEPQGPTLKLIRGVDRVALRAELSKRYEHTLRRLGR